MSIELGEQREQAGSHHRTDRGDAEAKPALAIPAGRTAGQAGPDVVADRAGE